MLELCDASKLTIEEYHKIFQASSRELKQQILLDAVGIEAIDEEDELGKSIVIDYCLELIVFTSNQGFSWDSVHRAVIFGLSLLDETACKGKNIEEAIKIFRDGITKEISVFANVEVKALIDYFLSTLYRHYHLYLFCMTREQKLDQRKCNIEVEAPFLPEQLSKGTVLEKWNYEQSMKKIEDEKERQQTIRLDSLKNKIEQLDQEKIDALSDLQDMRENKNTEELPVILERLTNLHVKSAESEIQNSIEDTRENIEMRMKKAFVAKPETPKRKALSRQRAKSRQKK